MTKKKTDFNNKLLEKTRDYESIKKKFDNLKENNDTIKKENNELRKKITKILILNHN